jgi:FtsH-binding integral membrane protein
MTQTFDKFYLYVILFITIIILFMINKYSFIDNTPTCNNFVLNVYLYLALSICSIGLFSYFINNTIYDNKDKTNAVSFVKTLNNLGPYYLLSIVFTFIFIFLIAFTNEFTKSGVMYNHLIWGLFLFFISVTIFPKFKDPSTYKFIDDAFLMTITIFITMTATYFLFPNFFNKNYNFLGMGLFIGLLSIIIVELLNLFLSSNPSNLHNYTSYIVILLFSTYVAYDTTTIMKLEKICKDMPNYPKLSVGFFLDMVNLFVRILYLKSKD